MDLSQYNREANLSLPIHQKLLLRWRYFFPVIIAVLLFMESTRHIVFGVISDAFFQVGVFVLATLSLYHMLANFSCRFKSGLFTNIKNVNIIFAAFLGALPGCGGAIIVMTQFIQGKFSFGAVVAVLTATMGDAAFILIASKPFDGLYMMAIGLSVGCITGYLVDYIFGNDYLRVPSSEANVAPLVIKDKTTRVATTLWKIILLPALAISILFSFQEDPNKFLGLPTGTVEIFGGFFAILGVILWAKEKTANNNQYQEFVSEEDKVEGSSWFSKAVQDTNFVLAWAIAAFILFELLTAWSGIVLTHWFKEFHAIAPLLGILVGLLPGCGPQIVVTSLYIQGAIPFSAQLGNAISNDGDALFPAIALAPKVAIYATLFSTVPAFIVAYGYYWLFEI